MSLFRKIVAACVLAALPACAAPPARPAAIETSAAEPFVIAANPLAAQAGLNVLKRGGSAVDAAIAIQAMLSLVEPQSSGVGGGAFMTFLDGRSGKITVYDGREPVALARLLDDRDAQRTLYFADENGGEPVGASFTSGPALILIGPEGGFSDEERAKLRALPYVVPISLGPRILRADTAAVAALAVIQAIIGDWR